MATAEDTGLGTEPLLVERDGPVLVVTLNRPQRLNALDAGLLAALEEAFLGLRDDDGVRAAVLTGSGRGFCAGADLRSARGDVRTILGTRYRTIIRLMREVEKPIVAAVNGVAAGAGSSLALAADLRVAAESASFLQAFVRIGLIPDAGATFFLPRLVGPARAAELAMLGEPVDATTAERIGLVTRVVPDAGLREESLELAHRLARGPRSIGLMKRAFNLSLTSDLGMQLQHEEDLQAIAASTADAAEGVTAFVERREARFTGR